MAIDIDALIDAIERDVPWPEVDGLVTRDWPAEPDACGELQALLGARTGASSAAPGLQLLRRCLDEGPQEALDWYCPDGHAGLGARVVAAAGAVCDGRVLDIYLETPGLGAAVEPFDLACRTALGGVPGLREAPESFVRYTLIRAVAAVADLCDQAPDGDDEVEEIVGDLARYLTRLAGEPGGDEPGAALLHLALGRTLRLRYLAHGDDADIERATDLVSAAAADPSARPRQRRDRQAALAECHFARYERTGERAHFDRALAALRAVAAEDLPGSEAIERAVRIGLLYLRAGVTGGAEDDLRTGLAMVRRAHGERTADDPCRAAEAMDLAERLAGMFERLAADDLDLLDEIVQLFAEAATTSDPGRRPLCLAELGRWLALRYERTGRAADLERSIGSYVMAVDETPPDDPDWGQYQHALADAYRARLERFEEVADLDLAIEAYRAASGSRDWEDYASADRDLTAALLLRYDIDGALADLEDAIGAAAAALPPAHHEDAPAGHGLLARTLLTRYGRTGELADLERALDQARTAVQRRSGVPAEVRRWRAMALLAEFERTGDTRHLYAALGECGLAEEPAPPAVATALLALRGRIGHAHAQATGDTAPLDDAIAALDAAAAGAAPPPEAARHETWLGAAMLDRYRHTGDLDDLDRAAAALRSALLRLDGLFVPAEYPAELSRILLHQYERTADPAVLAEARDLVDGAVRQASPGAPALGAMLAQQAAVRAAAFRRGGALEDLAAAIDLYERAAETGPPRSPRLPAVRVALGDALIRRFRLGRRTDARGPDDFNRAVAAYTEAIVGLPPDSADRAEAVARLGDAWRTRPRESDLGAGQVETAIGHYARSLRIAGASAGAAWARLGLGLAQLDRYRASRSATHLEEAVRTLADAGGRAPAGSAVRINTLAAHGTALRLQYDRRRSSADLRAAVACFEEVCVADADLEQVTQTGAEWGAWAMQRLAWDEADRAFTAALGAVREILQAQLARQHQEIALAAVQGMPAQAAYVKVMLDDPLGAVAVAEDWRAVLLSEALGETDAALAALAEHHRELYEEYTAAAERLGTLRLSDLGRRATAITRAQHGAALAAARRDLDEVVARVRAVDGLASFRRPLAAQDVAGLPAGMPLVYLIAAPAGGAALIMRPDAEPAVTAHPLPRLTTPELQRWLRQYPRRYAGRGAERERWREYVDTLARWLWDAAMGKVVDELDGHDAAAVVATGALSLLPLHAAWTPDESRPGGRRYALDHLALTFVPNARSLHAAQRLVSGLDEHRLLAVADPVPTSRPPLRHARAEIEAALAAFPEAHRRLVEERATKDTLLALLPHYPVVHVASHGSAHPTEPLDSSLELAGDEPVRLREILALRLGGVRLAVLSACETALPDLQLLDEAISLPTALLQARVAGVIATLWAVDDESAMLLMLRFYQLWRRDGQHPREALRRAQQWMRDTTTAAKQLEFPDAAALHGAASLSEPVRRWMQDCRSHREPAQWGAFVYVGA
ncbi:CHAT domain-containing protein [Dactylosporangium salmoneum]|uniref:CHAT domain-containing protein n=1 Tax=Dactylosporangium salmoneum TaxID=53361 RepID=A0ABN3FL52_9ACTN